MTPKQRKWLELVDMASRGSGMYAGERVDVLPPKVARWMEEAGYVYRVVPHNPVHKERLAVTEAGRAALRAKQ